ncbi:MAG: hypothetical protein IKT98_03530 [Selenomonadaceae bacterium]|nr:hypothetical protein [Selenomonadaceae bacterium]
MDENPFVNQNTTWQPPNKGAPNPYRQAKIVKQVVEVAPMEIPFSTADFEPKENGNPYVSAEKYQEQSGVRLASANATNSTSPYANARKITLTVGGNEINRKFIIEPDGVYLRPKNKLTDDPMHLCNFSFEIVALRTLKNRDGTVQREVVYNVISSALTHRAGEFDDKNLPSLPEEDYDRIVDEIQRQFKECYICPESRHSAKDYLREYGALVYREFRQSHGVEEFFNYHGWELVGGKMVYLSDSRADCKCGISIPKIPAERMAVAWRNDLQILEIGRKIFNADGTFDDVASLRVSLPFWLYLHLSFACRLFIDAGLKVQFLLLLIGKTGSLKTTICETFAEPFNEGSMLRFESTSRALELYREECIDQTMVVDDIFKKKSSNMSKFEDILRAFGEGIGRAKSAGKDFKEIMRTKVQGGCIVTAEHDLESQQSSTLRYVSVPLESDSINTVYLSMFQQDKICARLEDRPTIVQEIFAAWIEYLESNYEQLVKFLLTFQPPPLTLKFKRHQQIYRVLCAVATLITDWGRQSENLTSQQVQDKLSCWHRVIVDLMLRNQSAATEAEPWQQFLVTLQQAIATGTTLIAVNKDEFEQNGGRYAGFQRIDKGDAEYVLSPDKVISIARHLLTDSGRELVSDSTTIFKELLNHGVSKGYENKDGNGGTRKRYLKRVKLNGHLVEMLVLSKDALEKAIEKFLQEE